MLQIYETVQPDIQLIRDVEAEFFCTQIRDTPVTRRLLQDIEGAQYLSAACFVDRFGLTLPISDLSTGCKAALVVAANPDKLVDLIECGHNARDAIIRNVRDGKIIFYYNDIGIDYPGFDDYVIDVLYDGQRFTSLDAFNSYLKQEM